MMNKMLLDYAADTMGILYAVFIFYAEKTRSLNTKLFFEKSIIECIASLK